MYSEKDLLLSSTISQIVNQVQQAKQVAPLAIDDDLKVLLAKTQVIDALQLKQMVAVL